MERGLLIFLILFIAFWGVAFLGQGVAGPLYRRRYLRLYGRYPTKDDVPRWLWILLSPGNPADKPKRGEPPNSGTP